MLPCQKCGYDNELGRIFCHQCGAKLDLDAIKPASRGGKSLKRKSGNLVRWTRRLVLLVILGIAAYVLYVMSLVVPEPARPEGAETSAAEKKWMAVERLVGKRQAGSVEISPAEAKAFLARITFEKKDVKWGFVPDQVGIEFGADSVELSMWATLNLGGALEKKLCFSYTGTPKIQGKQLEFEPKGGAVGRLNWPLGMVNALGLHRTIFRNALARLKTENETLSQLNRIEVQPDRAILHYQPR